MNGVGGAGADTCSALNTFCIANLLYIHFAFSNAQSAIGAVFMVYSYANEGDLVKEAVKCSKGAKEAAEETEDEYACYKDGYHQKEFPSKEGTEHAQIAFVYTVREQSHCSFKCSGGANVFTKARQREVSECVGKGEKNYKEDQNYILEIREYSCNLVLFDLRSGDLM